MKIIFIPVGDYNDERSLYVKTENVEIMMGSDTDEIIKDLYDSLIQKYEKLIKHSTKHFELMSYDINKIIINRVGSYIESPEWLKSKKCFINPQNKTDNKCFQYATTVALIYEKINNHPRKISKIRPSISNYNWTEIDFPSNQKDWKKFETNNKSIALNILYIPHNTKDVRHIYKSKFNLIREHQIILLMITDDGENWHYLCVKKLSALLRGISSNHNGDVYCMNCFRAFRTKSKLEVHKKMCKNHDNCYVQMPNDENKILGYKENKKPKKAPFVIYSDLECLLEKTNNDDDENKQTTIANNHTSSAYSIYTQCSFHDNKNKLDYYRGKRLYRKIYRSIKRSCNKYT